ncbi:hypothetical protein D9757_004834 [Collybiopsis confluens]|uniref:F-box domain-containing protein n=1 Tax=Collybiopsis confluens TaxID=2823264 RepID=A0A8H5HSC2_9AGAR|nr:hypothetical protein D9757_004834 [Collybiopsis confluens]
MAFEATLIVRFPSIDTILPRRRPRASPILISRIPSPHILSSRIEGPIWLSKSNMVSIKHHILEAEHHFSSLQSLMMTMNVRQGSILYNEVIDQMDETLDEIAHLNNVLSPVRRIPLEILTEIFKVYCLLPSDTSGSVISAPNDALSRINTQFTSPSASFLRPRFILTSVCAAWRQAAHGTPLLWSKLKIFQLPDSRTSPRMICKWLSRSGICPIELDLTLSESATAILATVISFSFRIRSLRLSAPFKLLLVVFQSPATSFPSLEKLRIEVPAIDWQSRLLARSGRDELASEPRAYLQDKFPSGIRCFAGSKSLAHVEIAEHGEFSLLEYLVLPLELLKVLDIDANSALSNPTAYLHFLSRATSLVHLKFYSSEFLGRDGRQLLDQFTDSISLPLLNSLDISFRYSSYVAVKLFHCLVAPSLKRLRLLTLTEELDVDLTIQLLSFQKRSNISLSSLYLGGIEGQMEFSRILHRLSSEILPQLDSADSSDSTSIYNVPAAFSSITCLCIQENAHDLVPFLRALTKTSTLIIDEKSDERLQTTNFLPNLEELWLYLDAERCKTECLNLVLDMLQVRSTYNQKAHGGGGACSVASGEGQIQMRRLKKARIHIHDYTTIIPLETKRRLGRVQKGMDIKIWTHSGVLFSELEREQLELEGMGW